jgi:hypothetical protein
MTMDFAVSHGQETQDDCNPVHVIRDDGAVGGRVLPAKHGVEDTPSSTTIELWIAELENKVNDNKNDQTGRDER